MSAIFIIVLFLTAFSISFSFSQADAALVYDDDYYIEKFVDGFEWPTTMEFVGEDILILEKTNGKVIRIHENGLRYADVVLDVGVGFAGEAGMLGIESTDNHFYLYYTKSCNADEWEEEHGDEVYGQSGQLQLRGQFSEFGSSSCPIDDTDKHTTADTKNSLYQYDWDGQKLTNPVLLKELPSINNDHHGGIIAANGDDAIYFVIGDQNDRTYTTGRSLYGFSEDIETKPTNDFILASILKINNNEKTVEIFATGVRNSFGLAIDPVTGNLWDTENGENDFDEINLVYKGFNSGWSKVMGPNREPFQNVDPSDIPTDFLCTTACSTKGVSSPFPSLALSSEEFTYSDPEFSWEVPVGVTAIAFPDNNKFGKYSDWLFVGDFNNGRIYKFQLNEDRTGFVFSSPHLSDLVLDKYQRDFESEGIKCHACDELPHNDDDDPSEILFAEGIAGGVVDIEFHGSDMYVVSIFDGTIYKISPKQPLRPTQQYQDGFNHKEIVCKTTFMPIMSISSGINCVKPSTALILADRPNWTLSHSEMPMIELKYQNLRGLDFENTDLSYSDLRGSDFKNARITNVDFTGANLQKTNLSGADLTGTVLTGADLSNTNLSGTDLSGKDLRGAILVSTNLSNSDLTGADLTNVKLNGADLTEATLTNAILTEANLFNTNLTGTDLSNADLTGANLVDAYLLLTDLSNADLTGANLADSTLRKVNFSGTILTGADLTHVNLTTSTLPFEGSDLVGKDFTGTIFTGAILSELDLTGVDFTGAILYKADLSNSNLSGTDLSGTILSQANLSGTDLSGNDLRGTHLAGADLSDAILTGSDLSGKDLTGTIFVRADLSYSKLTETNRGQGGFGSTGK